MASVGTLFPTSSATTAASSTGTQNSSTSASSSTTGTDPLASQNTFLQLLVAQLQHQDPTQPMDGTTFVTQLATFSNLTESVATREDMDGISKQYLGSVPSAASSSDSSTSSTDLSAVTGG